MVSITKCAPMDFENVSFNGTTKYQLIKRNIPPRKNEFIQEKGF